MAKPPHKTKTNGAPPYTPSPAEIAYGCRKLHRRWTEQQEMARRVVKYEPYEFMPIPSKSLRLGIDVGSI